MPTPLKLYSYDACPFAQRTRMVMAEKRIDFELIEVDAHNKPADWEKISPYGKVPVLVAPTGSVHESAIINEYLEDAFPAHPLLPSDALRRAKARIWIDYCESRLLPASQQLLRDRNEPERRHNSLKGLQDVLLFIEREVFHPDNPGPYWLGAGPTLPDFHCFPFVERLGVHEVLADFTWPDAVPGLRRWLDTMRARASVAHTLRPIEFLVEQQQRLLRIIESRQSASR